MLEFFLEGVDLITRCPLKVPFLSDMPVSPSKIPMELLEPHIKLKQLGIPRMWLGRGGREACQSAWCPWPPPLQEEGLLSSAYPEGLVLPPSHQQEAAESSERDV